MKNQNLLKQIVLCTVMLFSLISCDKDDAENAGPLQFLPSMGILVTESDSSNVKSAEIALAKIKELGYISTYESKPGFSSYVAFPIFFNRENVKESQAEAVMAELVKEAKEHYEKATKEVNAFNFQSLYSEHLDKVFHVDIQSYVLIDGVNYKVHVAAGNPLITDKAWRCSGVAGCPIESITSWTEGKATVTLADATTTEATSYSRIKNTIFFVAGDYRYKFQIKTLTEIQLLLRTNTKDSSSESFKDKNYIFTLEK
ncbi:MAG: hypothetical protein ACRC3G_04905 [Bacteroidales bacterium]